jgi:hypothetical protein
LASFSKIAETDEIVLEIVAGEFWIIVNPRWLLFTSANFLFLQISTQGFAARTMQRLESLDYQKKPS